MKLRVKLTKDIFDELETPVKKFNQWQHKTCDISLVDSFVSMDLMDVPSFWEEFLEDMSQEHKEELRYQMTVKLADKTEKTEGRITYSLKKALEALGSKVI